MTIEDERAANELVGFLTGAVKYSGVASRSDVKAPLVKQADKLVKKLEGQPRNELELATANLKAL